MTEILMQISLKDKENEKRTTEMNVKKIKKTRRCANLTQLNVLVISHDQNDVGPNVSAVSLDAAPEALSPGSGEGPVAWNPV